MKTAEAKQLMTALLDFEFSRSYMNDIVRFVYILGIGFNALLAFLIFLQGLTLGGLIGGFLSLVVGAVGFVVGLAILRLFLEVLLAVMNTCLAMDSTAGTLKNSLQQ